MHWRQMSAGAAGLDAMSAIPMTGADRAAVGRTKAGTAEVDTIEVNMTAVIMTAVIMMGEDRQSAEGEDRAFYSVRWHICS